MGSGPRAAVGTVVPVRPRGVRVRVSPRLRGRQPRLSGCRCTWLPWPSPFRGFTPVCTTRPTSLSGPSSATCAPGRRRRWPPAWRMCHDAEVIAMANGADRLSADGAVVVIMNPRSGGGKVARFRLVERAQTAGAQVALTGPDQDPASLARAAIAHGVRVLGVAGGDGTVSAVAAVAAEARRPLVVIPAGTRNHFARDLGLNITNPASAMTALRAGDPAQVDLGRVGSRVFVNNVSFGAYADALLTPGYREAKARTLAEVAPG